MEKGKATRKKCKNRIVVAVVAAAAVAVTGVAAVVAVVVAAVAVAISGLRASWNLECLAG